jgi:hypothetical protein
MVKITKINTNSNNNDITKLISMMTLGDVVSASYVLGVGGERIKPPKKKPPKISKKPPTKKKK